MKRLISALMCMIVSSQLCVVTALAAPAWPSDTGIVSEGGIVIDADSGAMIFGQNSRKTYPPASITKLLTALVVLKHVALDETVTFSEDAVNNVEAGSGNALSLAVGDKLSVEDCLYALLLRSSNQAANALAEHVGGSRDGFVTMMNEEAAQLGCSGSLFKNPSGLNDPEQMVTPYDMALIAKAALEDEELLKISSTTSHTFPATIQNPEGVTASMEHRLLTTEDSSSPYYFPDAVAGKTGYTSLAGNTLVTYAQRDGRSLIAVILKGTQPQYYLDAVTLLEFGFQSFQNINIAEQETSYTTGDTEITVGDQSYAPSDLMIDTSAVMTLPKGAVFADAVKTLDATLPEEHPDGAVAVIRYTYNDRKIGEAYLSLKAGEMPVEIAEPEPVTLAETQPETIGPEASLPEESGEQTPDVGTPVAEPTRNDGITKILTGLAIVIVALLLAGGGYLYYERKQEEKRREARRARRRQRLMEDGSSEEAFEQMVNEKRNER